MLEAFFTHIYETNSFVKLLGMKFVSIEPGKAVRIGREMRGHPVHQHRKPGAVRSVNKARKALRFTKPGRGSIEPGGLVAPARIVGMLGNRHELDMGESQVRDIVDEIHGEFAAIVAKMKKAAPSKFRIVNSTSCAEKKANPPRVNPGSPCHGFEISSATHSMRIEIGSQYPGISVRNRRGSATT